jgi:hypothetical protein
MYRVTGDFGGRSIKGKLPAKNMMEAIEQTSAMLRKELGSDAGLVSVIRLSVVTAAPSFTVAKEVKAPRKSKKK